MSGNARFHDKLHRSNHHTNPTDGLLDSGYDPIASPEYPFQGDFILSGALSSSGDLSAENLNLNGELFCNFPDIAGISPTSTDITLLYSITNTNSSNWDSTYNSLCSMSGNYDDTFTWVQTNSSNMYVDRLGINTDINPYYSDLKLVVQGDTAIYGNLSSLGTTTLVNVTANVTDALSVVNPGFGSPNAIFIDQGGPDAAIKLQNNGSGPMMILNGNGNVGIATDVPLSKLHVQGDIRIENNSHLYLAHDSNDTSIKRDPAANGIGLQTASTTRLFVSDSGNVGIGEIAPAEKLTVYGSVSASAKVYAWQGNSDEWNDCNTIVKTYSGNWENTYSTVSANSASWGEGGSVSSNLNILSSNWENTYSTVSANSASWGEGGSVSSNLNILSSNWENTYSTVSANSGSWNSYTNFIKLKSYSETSQSPSIVSNVATLDLSGGTVFSINLNNSINNFVLQNIPTGVNSFLLSLTQDAIGSKTVTWVFTGKTIKWSGGIPIMTNTANATDIYSFMSIDGNIWFGSVAGKNFV